MRIYSAVLIFFIGSILGLAQSKTIWFPSKLNIRPFTANLLEARNGASYLFGENKIRLDIGSSKDILQIRRRNTVLSFGADMFTFTRLRSEKNFRFPVETIDFFFGINAGYKVKRSSGAYGFRLRFSHISAHLVDGRYLQKQNSWVDNYTPFSYSREFIELFPFYKMNSLRLYLGLTYLIHVIPDGFGHGIYQTGFDYYFPNLFAKKVNFFIADDFKINNFNEGYFGNNIAKVGMKFGDYNIAGFSIFFSYYSGKSVHGELYSISEHYFTIGFNVGI
ncbi:MAG TPA: DUF1207 domain-containing protein [Ignavibacteria bacterium]|nr:DUF1207 domain-containing protein [Ignavibacteria bacterium]